MMRVIIMMTVMISSMLLMLTMATVVSVLFLAEEIGLIPCSEDEYLECRVEVYYEYKQYDANNSKDNEKYNLEIGNPYECECTRDEQWYTEKYSPNDNRAKVEEEARKVESSSNRNIVYCHAS